MRSVQSAPKTSPWASTPLYVQSTPHPSEQSTLMHYMEALLAIKCNVLKKPPTMTGGISQLSTKKITMDLIRRARPNSWSTPHLEVLAPKCTKVSVQQDMTQNRRTESTSKKCESWRNVTNTSWCIDAVLNWPNTLQCKNLHGRTAPRSRDDHATPCETLAKAQQTPSVCLGDRLPKRLYWMAPQCPVDPAASQQYVQIYVQITEE